MQRSQWKWVVAMAGCLMIGFGGGAMASRAKKDLVLVRPDQAKWVASFPQDPQHSPQLSFVYGDPATGPVAFLLKYKGAAPPHWHTSDYWSVTLEGKTRHFLQGKESSATDNPPGTFWFQPGGDPSTAHNDVCLTESGCTMFIFMDKKNDVIPVGAPPKG
jgi:hypothetical protein